MYPNDEFLEKIRHWNLNDFDGFFEYIKEFWLNNSGIIGRRQVGEEVIVELHTGHSPYNEIVIGNLAINSEFWLLYWRMSLRGGYYEFSKGYTVENDDSQHYTIEAYI